MEIDLKISAFQNNKSHEQSNKLEETMSVICVQGNDDDFKVKR